MIQAFRFLFLWQGWVTISLGDPYYFSAPLLNFPPLLTYPQPYYPCVPCDETVPPPPINSTNCSLSGNNFYLVLNPLTNSLAVQIVPPAGCKNTTTNPGGNDPGGNTNGTDPGGNDPGGNTNGTDPGGNDPGGNTNGTDPGGNTNSTDPGEGTNPGNSTNPGNNNGGGTGVCSLITLITKLVQSLLQEIGGLVSNLLDILRNLLLKNNLLGEVNALLNNTLSAVLGNLNTLIDPLGLGGNNPASPLGGITSLLSGPLALLPVGGPLSNVVNIVKALLDAVKNLLTNLLDPKSAQALLPNLTKQITTLLNNTLTDTLNDVDTIVKDLLSSNSSLTANLTKDLEILLTDVLNDTLCDLERLLNDTGSLAKVISRVQELVDNLLNNLLKDLGKTLDDLLTKALNKLLKDIEQLVTNLLNNLLNQKINDMKNNPLMDPNVQNALMQNLTSMQSTLPTGLLGNLPALPLPPGIIPGISPPNLPTPPLTPGTIPGISPPSLGNLPTIPLSPPTGILRRRRQATDNSSTTPEDPPPTNDSPPNPPAENGTTTPDVPPPTNNSSPDPPAENGTTDNPTPEVPPPTNNSTPDPPAENGTTTPDVPPPMNNSSPDPPAENGTTDNPTPEVPPPTNNSSPDPPAENGTTDNPTPEVPPPTNNSTPNPTPQPPNPPAIIGLPPGIITLVNQTVGNLLENLRKLLQGLEGPGGNATSPIIQGPISSLLASINKLLQNLLNPLFGTLRGLLDNQLGNITGALGLQNITSPVGMLVTRLLKDLLGCNVTCTGGNPNPPDTNNTNPNNPPDTNNTNPNPPDTNNTNPNPPDTNNTNPNPPFPCDPSCFTELLDLYQEAVTSSFKKSAKNVIDSYADRYEMSDEDDDDYIDTNCIENLPNQLLRGVDKTVELTNGLVSCVIPALVCCTQQNSNERTGSEVVLPIS